MMHKNEYLNGGVLVLFKVKRWVSFILSVLLLINTLIFTDILLLRVNAGGDIVIYVSPDGDNSNSGNSPDEPVTLMKAKQMLREIPRPLTGNVTVLLRGGKYYLEDTLAFTEADGGDDTYRVEIKAYNYEVPEIIHGMSINSWQPVTGTNYYKATIGVDQKYDYKSLFEDGKRAVIARFPNEIAYGKKDYLTVKTSVTSAFKTKFGFGEQDIPLISTAEGLEVAIWPGGKDGEWNWFENIIPVKNLDYNSGIIELKSSAQYELGAGSRYFIQGALELLDTKGEFYFDKYAGEMYYYPRGNKDISSMDIFIPSRGDALSVVGTSPLNPVKNLHFSGIVLKGSEREYNGIRISNAENVSVSKSHISLAGNAAVFVSDYSENIFIKDNLIEDIGRDGIIFENWTLSFQPVSQGHIISNNIIRRCGQIFGDGAGIHMVGTTNANINHNRIYDLNRFAICVRTGLGAGLPSNPVDGVIVTKDNVDSIATGKGNVIEYNDLSECNKDSQDTAVIYTWGVTGTIIRYNRIHDSSIYFSYGQGGIYLDDNSRHSLVYGNIIENMQNDPQAKGKMESAILAKGVNNIIENNIIVNSLFTEASLFPYRTNDGWRYEDDYVSSLSRNIVFNAGDTVVKVKRYVSQNTLEIAERNIYYNSNEKYLYSGIPNISDIDDAKYNTSKKYEKFSITMDPGFMDINEGDYRFRYDSPARKLGIEEIDASSIGLKEENPFMDQSDLLKNIFVKSDKAGSSAVINLKTSGDITAKLSVSGRSVKGYNIDLDEATINFSSNNPEIATVSSTGMVTAVSAGMAIITITVNKEGIQKSQKVYVFVDDFLSSVEILSPDDGLLVGESMPLRVVGKTLYGQIIDLTNNATFTSEPADIFEINGPIIKALHPGTATITAQAEYDGVLKTSNKIIYSNDKALNKVIISLDNPAIKKGEHTGINVQAYLNDNSIADLGSASFSYKLSDNTIAYISETEIYGIEQGETLLSVKVQLNGITVIGKYGVVVFPDNTNMPSGWNVKNYMTSQGYADIKQGKITLVSTGKNVWRDSDDFTFLYRSISARDGEKVTITATIESFSGSKPDASIGLMFRDKDTADSYHVHHRFTLNGGLRYVYRNDESLADASRTDIPDAQKKYWGSQTGVLYEFSKNISFPAKLKLVKDGNMVTGYYQKDGVWELMGSVSCEFTSDTVLAGVGLFSDGGSPVKAVLTELVVSYKTYENRIKNPGFENGADYWILGNEAVISDLDAREGSKCIKVSSPEDYVAIIQSEPAYSCSAGMYYASAYLKGNGDFNSVSLEVYAGSDLISSKVLELSDSWTKITIDGISVPDGADVTIKLLADGKAGAVLYADDFSLKMQPPNLDLVKVLLNRTGMLIGETRTIEVKAFMEDNSEADLNDAVISYSSDHPEIVSVNEVTGEVTAISLGTAVITADVTLQGITRSGKTTVVVTTAKDAYRTHSMGKADKIEGPAYDVWGDGEWGFGNAKNGLILAYFNMDFAISPQTKMLISVKSGVSTEYSGGRIEIYLDNKYGQLLGSVTIPETDSSFAMRQGSDIEITPVTGVHDIYFVFVGTKTNHQQTMGNFESFTFKQPVPIKDAYEQISFGYFDNKEGPDIQNWGDLGWGFGSGKNGLILGFKNFDFGNNAQNTMKFTMQTQAVGPYSGGNIEIRLGSKTGQLLGTVTIPESPDWSTKTVLEPAEIAGATGVHDVYLVFKGTNPDHNGSMGNFYWFKFIRGEDPEQNNNTGTGGNTDPGTGGGNNNTGTGGNTSGIAVSTQNNEILVNAGNSAGKIEIPRTNMQQAVNNALSKKEDRIAVKFEGVNKEINISVPFDTIKTAAQNNVKKMVVDSGAKKIEINIVTIRGLNASQNATLEIATAEKNVSELPQNIKELVGSNKVYEFKISLDGREIAANSQGVSKIAKLEIPLTVDSKIKPTNVVAYTVENNKLKVIKNSWYDDKEKVIKVNADAGALITFKAVEAKLKDVDESKWFAQPVNTLYAREIVSGFGDGSFKPENKVTREQFIKMIVSMFDLVDQSAQSSFKDISKDAWYYTYVASAEKLGITNGIGNGAFGAGKEITRQEMAAMMYRAMNVLGIKLEAQNKDTFADIANVPQYAREAVIALQQYGIVSGVGNNKFDPASDSTRAQSATIIYNLFLKVVNQ